jgi:hypothetical protein
MIKILIVSYYFPPANDIGSRRFGTMSGCLEKAGMRVNVLTTHSQGSLPVLIAEDQVIRIGTNRQRSASVEDLAAERLPWFIDIIRRPARKWGLYMWSVDRTVTTWYREIMANIDAIDSHIEKPDLIIGSFGPSASLWGARFLSRHFGKPWLADYRDLGALRDDDRCIMAKAIDRIIEKRLVASAAGVTTVSHTLKDILARRYRKPTEVIYNGWDSTSGNVIPHRPPNRANYLYYAGRFYPAQMPAVETLLDALAGFPSLTLRIRSLGPHDSNCHLLMYAAHLGIKDRIILLPPCDQQTVNLESEGAWANLIFEDMSVRTRWSRGTLTGKLFEYLARTPPILAIGRPDSEIGEILKETSKGALCSNLDNIMNFIKSVATSNAIYQADRTAINRFSREQQSARLKRFIEELVLKRTADVAHMYDQDYLRPG